MTEKEKKDLGLWYWGGFDGSTREAFFRGNTLCYEFNKLSPLDREKQVKILDELFGTYHDSSYVLTPFYCDYGYNIKLGKNCFINHNVYLMDCAPITIGDHVLIGPSTGFYTAVHATHYKDRNLGLERTEPIIVGDNVWIGGDVTVMPGVTIGSGSIIGAKSLVNKDVPPNVIAAGNPIRIIREITKEDLIDQEILDYYSMKRENGESC